MEGVLNVLRVKKIASSAIVLLSVGALAAALGVSAFSAAGQADGPTAVPSSTKAPKPSTTAQERAQPPVNDVLTLSRAQDLLGGPAERSDPLTFVKTYYVGDIVMPRRPQPTSSSRSAAGPGATATQPMVDMRPLIELIVSTVARGSWRAFDNQGREITPQDWDRSRPGGPTPPKPVGAITPFFLNYSLIVRQTKEGHEELAGFLRKLRRLLEPNAAVEEERLATEHRPPAVPAPPPVLGGPKTVVPVDHGARDRIQRLLEELSKEIAKLPRDRD
jgi:hypothetical protein